MDRLRFAVALAVLSVAGCGTGRGGVPVSAREIVVRYSVPRADPAKGVENRTLTISDGAVLERIWNALEVEAKEEVACSCDLVNDLRIRKKDGREERWHFCHRPTVIGVYGALWTVTPGFYDAIRREVAVREQGPVGLICHNEDLR